MCQEHPVLQESNKEMVEPPVLQGSNLEMVDMGVLDGGMVQPYPLTLIHLQIKRESQIFYLASKVIL